MTAFATVGLLYPGEMGASLGKLLTNAGVRVVTTLTARGPRTAQLSREAGIESLSSLEEVVGQSTMILSLVETSSAATVAESYASLARLAPPGTVYVEANSIGPETMKSIAATVSAAGCDVVDGAINGPARTLSTGGTLYLSGSRADEVSSLLGKVVRVRVLGTEIGQASTMKMLLGGLTKGTCALFLELATLAERRGMLPEMMEAITMIYPGIAILIDRMLPTYARHAGRRSVEMQELEQTLQNSGMEPCLVGAICKLHDQLAAMPFDPSDGASVASLIQRTVAGGLLATESKSTSAEPKVA